MKFEQVSRTDRNLRFASLHGNAPATRKLTWRQCEVLKSYSLALLQLSLHCEFLVIGGAWYLLYVSDELRDGRHCVAAVVTSRTI